MRERPAKSRQRRRRRIFALTAPTTTLAFTPIATTCARSINEVGNRSHYVSSCNSNRLARGFDASQITARTLATSSMTPIAMAAMATAAAAATATLAHTRDDCARARLHAACVAHVDAGGLCARACVRVAISLAHARTHASARRSTAAAAAAVSVGCRRCAFACQPAPES